MFNLPLHNRNGIQKKTSIIMDFKEDLSFTDEFIRYEKIRLPLVPTAVQSVMGTGKTTYVRYFIEEAKRQNKKVLYICPNTVTVDSTYETLTKNGITAYHYKGENPQIQAEVVVSTIDSCDPWLDYDVIIVDEVLSLFSETNLKLSNTASIEALLWVSRYKRIMSHPLPIILDRYIAPVLSLFDASFYKIKNLYQKSKTVYDYSNVSRDKFLDLVIDTAKTKRVTLHTNWISTIERLQEKHSIVGGSILKAFHSKSDTKLRELKSSTLMCSTSKLSRGVDLSAEEVFLQDTGGTHSVITSLQMIDRARDSKVINIRVPFNKSKGQEVKRYFSSYVPTDKHEIRLHQFDTKMDYLDLNYKEVLYYLVSDTYLMK